MHTQVPTLCRDDQRFSEYEMPWVDTGGRGRFLLPPLLVKSHSEYDTAIFLSVDIVLMECDCQN